MKKILITGGAGFIGSNLTKTLLENGDYVIAVDNLITSDGTNLNFLRTFPNFYFLQHDITKPFSKIVKNQLSNVNHIYHLACPTGVPNLVKLAEEMLVTCSTGTKNILDFALENSASLVFTSSSEVYGNPEKFPQDENYNGNADPTGIRSPYEEGKRFSESLIVAYVRKFGLDAKIVRVFNTYGPGTSSGETRVITRFLRDALQNKNLPVQGDGSQKRTFCYVDDLIEALILIMDKGIPGEVYNAGGNVEIPIIELASLVLSITGSSGKIEFVVRPEHDHQGRLPDLTKIRSLGWKQKTGLKEGLLSTIGKEYHRGISASI